MKCLEPPCGQEKTSKYNFFAKYTWFANKYESQLKTARKEAKNLLKTAIFAGRQSHPGNGEQTFYTPLFAVTTTCCVPQQIPVRKMKEHSREIFNLTSRCQIQPQNQVSPKVDQNYVVFPKTTIVVIYRFSVVLKLAKSLTN